MRKLLLALGFIITITFFLPVDKTFAATVENDHDKLFEVEIANVTMRTAPDKEAEVVGQLKDGDQLRTFDEKNGWVKTFYNGQPVWVETEGLLLKEDNSTKEKQKDEEIPNDNEEENIEEDVQDVTNEEQEESEESETGLDSMLEEQLVLHAVEEKEDLPVGIYQPKSVQISEEAIIVLNNQLEGYKIMIDAGHGGEDSGAVNSGVLEKDLTLATAHKVKEHLEKEGAEVLLTRNDDTFISLQNRVNKSNTENADAFISLHYDYFRDSDANGINTYYYHPSTSGDLAEKIHAALVNELDMTDRGVRREGYYVIQHNQNPSVLLELGFMSNKDDLNEIQKEAYQEAVAKAITSGLMEYFDVSDE
ncbi:N-acetylmuramoyl-L-alanine amidase [Ornithinibacillus halotolerans]|uniref:MurNAc-LAA domain-containing protein n=1 Tax=Ornithinibacillus halotolerans TaxID=1274357 RepID=A0A916RQM1_9BACI|nr:N-acetylmuramoyl-L-alanine amidase [Ornithinibacillus halotolerans]GGA65696.1 hypothetical protein GCM10008025_06860 [Ornithinibacillus halotolerans]